MKKIAARIGKGAIFCLLALLMLIGISRVLMIKGKEYELYTTYAQDNAFYAMKKNTVDVLFLGSSHSYCGFSPQDFYDLYGIRSYNLGTSRQSIWLSYYWLREALKTQHPQVVVQEVYYMDQVNGNEPSIQKALSYMKWSKNKAEAVRMAVEQFPELDFKSFVFPSIRFHDRWRELTSDDFFFWELRKAGALKGHVPAAERVGETEYKLIRGEQGEALSGYDYQTPSAEEFEWPALSQEYLEKITDLCRENEITLILVKNPTTMWTVEEHNAIQRYAKENALAFYDLNTDDYYAAMNYNFAADNKDEGHPNLWGAEKIAKLLGKILTGEYGVPSVKDEQWEETAAYAQKIKKEFALRYIEDPQEYLRALADGDYSIFISVKGSAEGMGENLRRAMGELGLTGSFEGSYAAVLDGESVQEKEREDGNSIVQGAANHGVVGYQVLSQREGEDKGSIMIDGKEHSPNKNGINIVVRSREMNVVLDTVCLAADNDYELER